ncbi:50S ribosomal protein L9 [Nocardiopsis xinjiangensis]|uniref:50S ribosomal protein L9 n=1 Tax=Nocardiopsis xinjiangensis TaxID=124285 RepID=UPI000345CF77|nr:50S ribosomal protein L9 [Nocardiopsis xinjiangensis]
MKLILTHEVNGLGAPGDVVEVRNGYGRNYLLPRGFAIPWTRGGQKQIDLIQRARRSRDIRTLDEARQIAGQVEALTVRLKQRAGEGGRLFGSVTAGDVAEAVQTSGGPELDKRRIEIKNAIKSVGSYKVDVRLHPEVNATIKLDVAGV